MPSLSRWMAMVILAASWRMLATQALRMAHEVVQPPQQNQTS